jgi:hypothetical protein
MYLHEIQKIEPYIMPFRAPKAMMVKPDKKKYEFGGGVR